MRYREEEKRLYGMVERSAVGGKKRYSGLWENKQEQEEKKEKGGSGGRLCARRMIT